MKAVLKRVAPWWTRIAIKMLLSRLPLDYPFWKKIGIFVLGEMDNPQVAYRRFVKDAKMAQVLDNKTALPKLNGQKNFNVMELGPGDSLFTMVVAKTLGASGSYLIDAGPFATTEVEKYRELLGFLENKGLALPFKKEPETFEEILDVCNGRYLTEGVKSFESVPSGRIDFCFSSTVLQHVYKDGFPLLAEELYRVMKKNSTAIHSVDFTDCISGAVDFKNPSSGNLNNMRFPEAIWESSFFRNSGFYTNRLRLNEMLNIFDKAGFMCRILETLRWDRLPINRKKLARAFQQFNDEDLLVKHSYILLQKA